MRNRTSIWVATAALAAWCSPNIVAAQTKPSPDQLFGRGEALVNQNCGRCHATEAIGKSLHAEAPPFRELLERYPVDALEEGFVDEIYSMHPDMPVFKVTSEQLEAIIYYIASIQDD